MKQEQQVSDETWRRKDYLSARQTAVNATSYVFEGKEVSPQNFLDFADRIFFWLFQEQLPLPDVANAPKIAETKSEIPKNSLQDLPVPQLEQKKILDMIAEKLNLDEIVIRPSVNKWTLEVTKGKQQYPTNVNSIDKFIKWFNEEK